jgi:hypothetical protein
MYYWWIELIILSLAGTWLLIRHSEKKRQAAYTAIPGSFPDEPTYTTATDVVPLNNGAVAEFDFDIIIEKAC